MSIQVFCPFFAWVIFLILIYVDCLHVLDINPLSVIPFANIISHSVGCLFILSVASFAVQKFLSLIRSQFSIVAFISFPLGDIQKTNIAMIYVKECSTCFHLVILLFPLLHIGL